MEAHKTALLGFLCIAIVFANFQVAQQVFSDGDPPYDSAVEVRQIIQITFNKINERPHCNHTKPELIRLRAPTHLGKGSSRSKMRYMIVFDSQKSGNPDFM